MNNAHEGALDRVRAKVAELRSLHGTQLTQDPIQLRAVLIDLLPEDRRAIDEVLRRPTTPAAEPPQDTDPPPAAEPAPEPGQTPTAIPVAAPAPATPSSPPSAPPFSPSLPPPSPSALQDPSPQDTPGPPAPKPRRGRVHRLVVGGIVSALALVGAGFLGVAAITAMNPDEPTTPTDSRDTTNPNTGPDPDAVTVRWDEVLHDAFDPTESDRWRCQEQAATRLVAYAEYCVLRSNPKITAFFDVYRDVDTSVRARLAEADAATKAGTLISESAWGFDDDDADAGALVEYTNTQRAGHRKVGDYTMTGYYIGKPFSWTLMGPTDPQVNKVWISDDFTLDDTSELPATPKN